MQDRRTVALDLPQKIFVYEANEGAVHLAYNDLRFLTTRHGITGQDQRLTQIATLLEEIATYATEETDGEE